MRSYYQITTKSLYINFLFVAFIYPTRANFPRNFGKLIYLTNKRLQIEYLLPVKPALATELPLRAPLQNNSVEESVVQAILNIRSAGK